MKDIFEQNSTRPNDQLLGATASVPNGHKNLDQVASEGSNTAADSAAAAREAEGMAHYLLTQSKKPAIMVLSHWTPLNESYNFPSKAIFAEAAQKEGCVVHQMTCPDQGGTRHMLFIGKSSSVKESDYLSCIRPSLPHLA